MRWSQCSIPLFLLTCAGAALLASESCAAETKAGTATTVENRVLGILHGNSQLLSAGSDVFMDQTVKTEDESTTQLQLLDQTNISVGTRSEVVLNRFIFDPAKPKGDVVLTATRGVFRFVTGVQDHSSYKIKTPAATIGVRGTVVQFFIPAVPSNGPKPNDIFQIVLESGQADVTKLDGEVVPLNEPNIVLTIHSDGSHDQKPWVGKLSLYQLHVGDITGTIGASGFAGGSPGGPVNITSRGASSGSSSGGSTPPNQPSNTSSSFGNLLTFQTFSSPGVRGPVSP